MLKLAWKYMRYYKSQTFAIFASILLTASLLSGISSLIYSSQKSDLANSKTIYGDWHYYIETDKELFNSVESGEKRFSEYRSLEKCSECDYDWRTDGRKLWNYRLQFYQCVAN